MNLQIQTNKYLHKVKKRWEHADYERLINGKQYPVKKSKETVQQLQ